MILRKKTLERLINETGFKTIHTIADGLNSCTLINSNYHNHILETGYDALRHRKQRLLDVYELRTPHRLNKKHLTHLETYIKRMMTKKAYELMITEPPVPHKTSIITKLFLRYHHK